MLNTTKLGLVLGAALLAAPFTASAQEAAPAAFNQCKACHVIGKNGVGPNLAGVFGRKAGSVEGFKYSDQMKAAPAWDEAQLTKYLPAPKGARWATQSEVSDSTASPAPIRSTTRVARAGTSTNPSSWL